MCVVCVKRYFLGSSDCGGSRNPNLCVCVCVCVCAGDVQCWEESWQLFLVPVTAVMVAAPFYVGYWTRKQRTACVARVRVAVAPPHWTSAYLNWPRAQLPGRAAGGGGGGDDPCARRGGDDPCARRGGAGRVVRDALATLR